MEQFAGNVPGGAPAPHLPRRSTRATSRCASAAAACYCREGGDPERALFELLLGYAVTEDGALHAEKYYGTMVEEFADRAPGVPRCGT